MNNNTEIHNLRELTDSTKGIIICDCDLFACDLANIKDLSVPTPSISEDDMDITYIKADKPFSLERAFRSDDIRKLLPGRIDEETINGVSILSSYMAMYTDLPSKYLDTLSSSRDNVPGEVYILHENGDKDATIHVIIPDSWKNDNITNGDNNG